MTYTIGGAVTGLSSDESAVLENNGADALSVSSNSSFSFTSALASGATYSVTVGTQPSGETCTVSNGSGTVGSSNVTNIGVSCGPVFGVGGTVTGLSNGASITLQNDGIDALSVTGNGAFLFKTGLADGRHYSATVMLAPIGETCSVVNGAGTINGQNVNNVAIFCAPVFSASSGNWVWIGGSNIANTAGIYGTLAVDGSANMPGSRWFASSWADSNGNLWLFGGTGLDATGGYSFLNDLWKYDPKAGDWTWAAGSSTIDSFGHYGALGVGGAASEPGARMSSTAWIDASNDLVLFGGEFVFPNAPTNPPTVMANDLWSFSTGTGDWTWIAGPSGPDQAGSYGALGVPTAATIPGARMGASSWTDSAGNYWLFGGYAYDQPAGSFGVYTNDLWKFTPASGLWTWIGGSSSGNQSGVYGTQGVAAANNVPGSRANAASWVDSSGDFWLFGGGGYDVNGSNSGLNDLWKYDPGTATWTWVDGANTINSPGNYGTLGVAAVTNAPPARQSPATWMDAAGNFWLFGGDGGGSELNDLWKYNPGTRTWTWLAGAKTAGSGGSYGVFGVGAATNVPPARGKAVAWTDPMGNFWLFGGTGVISSAASPNSLNDLWVYTPAP